MCLLQSAYALLPKLGSMQAQVLLSLDEQTHNSVDASQKNI